MVLLLILAALIFVETPAGQQWLGQQITKKLSRDLNTRIAFKHIKIGFFNKLELQDFILEDQQKDTLLFARNLQVRITDWFFLKNKADIKYVEIDNAIVRLQKIDTTWNYQFLVNYFTPTSKQPKKSSSFEINLQKIALRNVMVTQKDPWQGEDMTAFVGSLDMDAKEINFSKQNIAINSLNISQPLFSIYTYKGKMLPLPAKKDTVVDRPKDPSDTLLQWNAAGWTMNIASLNINNGVFKNIKESEKPGAASFDASDLELTTINGRFNNVNLYKDTFSTKIVDLNAKERSGFLVKTLKTNFKINPKQMIFNNLELRTNNSVVRDYIALNYSDIADMGDFLKKVKLQANFDNATVDSDDLGYFASNLRTWKKTIRISGNIKSTAEDIKGKNLVINVGNSTYINGDLSLAGLPNIDQTFIDFRSNDTRTNYNDLVKFIPSIRNIQQPDLARLGNIHFKGAFTGFVRDFVAFGTIQTNLGTITSDLNVKSPAGKELVYSGKLATTGFRLGEFIKNDDLGLVSFSGNFKGHGVDIKTLGVNLDAKIGEIQYRGYPFRNIVANGKLESQLFTGFLSIDDPNLQVTTNGSFAFKGEQSSFDLVADVQKANLKPMGFTTDSVFFNGHFNLDFTGNNIDDFLGTAKITNANLVRNDYRLAFDSLVLHSDYANGVRSLSLQSNEFDGNITGDFHIADLPNSIKLFLNKYYPAYVQAPSNAIEHQNFTFNLVTREVDQLVQILDPNLKGFNDSKFDGLLDLPTHRLELNVQVPRFSYNNYVFTNTNVKGSGNLAQLNMSGNIQNVAINDTVNLPNTAFNITARNDSSNITLTTSANQAVTRANLNASLITYNDGVKINFDTSSFVLNSKTWSIDKGGSLTFRKNTKANGEVVLRESEQMISLKTIPSDTGDWNDLQVKVDKLNLGDVAPYFIKSPRIEGLISGTGKVVNPGSSMIATGDFSTEFLRVNGDSLGVININQISFDNKNDGNLKFIVTNTDPDHSINATANIYLSGNHTDNLINVDTKDYQLKILESFLGDVFSQIEGYATAKMAIKGDFKELDFVGKARLHNVGLRPKFTGVFYKIDDTDIDLREDEIDFGTLRLTDPVTGNHAKFTGNITHHAWKDMFFDLFLETGNEPITLLNTTYAENSAFYGHALGTGSMELIGPETDLFMQITARASEADSSYISIPPQTSKSGGFADFMVERTHGHSLSDSIVVSAISKLTYDIDLIADPHTTINVVLDQLTGDSITARGQGSLNIRGGTTEPLSLNGSYFIEEGSYVYTFQSFFKRPFQLRKDEESYIKWNGDPNKATINFSAEYVAPKVSFAPIAVGADVSPAAQTARENVTVIVHMTGELFQPTFDFKLDFPAGSVAISDPILAFNLNQIENNPNEINKQVTYLIVFNSFAPIGNQSGAAAIGASGGLQGAATQLAYNTLSSLMFNEVNKLFSNAIASVFKDDKLRVNLSGQVYNRNAINQNNFTAPDASNVNLVVSRAWLKDRLIITAGSTMDIPLQAQSNATNAQRFEFLPDVSAEYLVNPNGSIRVSLFYKENLDFASDPTGSSLTSAHNRRRGASLSLRKESDSVGGLFVDIFNDIFHPGKNKRPATTPPTETAITPDKEKKNSTNQ